VAELQTLEDLLGDRDKNELVTPLPAVHDGRSVTITAVLERTAVYEPIPADVRRLAARTHILVDPGAVRWRRIQADQMDAARRSGRQKSATNRTGRARERTPFNGAGWQTTTQDSEELKRLSDVRAIRDQVRHGQGR
jgi:hypothetical protein